MCTKDTFTLLAVCRCILNYVIYIAFMKSHILPFGVGTNFRTVETRNVALIIRGWWMRPMIKGLAHTPYKGLVQLSKEATVATHYLQSVI